MARLQQSDQPSQFYGVGIYHFSNQTNIGTLWRSAFVLNASFIFTVGKPYQFQGSDVYKTWSKIPLYHYEDILDLKKNLPYSTQLIGIELTEEAERLQDFHHPDRAAYLLGSEIHGLPEVVLNACHRKVKLPGSHSLNVASTGSIVMYDRLAKTQTSSISDLPSK